MSEGRPGGGGLGYFKLTLVAAVLVISLATGDRIDVGALFLPVGIVAVLVISPPTFPAVVSWYRWCLAAAGTTTALLAIVGIAAIRRRRGRSWRHCS